MTLETLANDTSTLTIFCIVVLCIVSNDTVHSSGPQFIQSIQNKTVIQGEDVKMVCKVQDIGKHKVISYGETGASTLISAVIS
ncbi:Uncharacterised protein r2_g3323 [Pycnogonum litorale]